MPSMQSEQDCWLVQVESPNPTAILSQNFPLDLMEAQSVEKLWNEIGHLLILPAGQIVGVEERIRNECSYVSVNTKTRTTQVAASNLPGTRPFQ
jgi:hypothetical protein